MDVVIHPDHFPPVLKHQPSPFTRKRWELVTKSTDVITVMSYIKLLTK